MKQILYISLFIGSNLALGQIADPTPNFDIELAYQKPVTPGDKWDFAKKVGLSTLARNEKSRKLNVHPRMIIITLLRSTF